MAVIYGGYWTEYWLLLHISHWRLSGTACWSHLAKLKLQNPTSKELAWTSVRASVWAKGCKDDWVIFYKSDICKLFPGLGRGHRKLDLRVQQTRLSDHLCGQEPGTLLSSLQVFFLSVWGWAGMTMWLTCYNVSSREDSVLKALIAWPLRSMCPSNSTSNSYL